MPDSLNREVWTGIIKTFFYTVVLIYVLLAIRLRSYAKPIVIMAVVPFGFVGAAFGHLIMELPLRILSFFGMLAATGVVVNDSLVLVTTNSWGRGSSRAVLRRRPGV